MSSREFKTTQMIADVATSISAQTGLSLEESMNFIYNSESLNKILNPDTDCQSYEAIESALIEELRYPAS